jgi:hypothetical protein
MACEGSVESLIEQICVVGGSIIGVYKGKIDELWLSHHLTRLLEL